MTKILFVCLGNICRSPMAEFIMKDLAVKSNLSRHFVIQSAATSNEEVGNPVYPPARRELAKHGISAEGKTARQLLKSDYERFDLLIGMETRNLTRMKAICGGDPDRKIYRLLDFTDRPGDIADPWYTDDFETAWNDILRGCEGLLAYLEKDKQ